jgi:hypothetical protein
MQRAVRNFALGSGSSPRRLHSLVLLVASGPFLRSLVKLVTMDIGFDRSNVLIVHADLHTARVTSSSPRCSRYREQIAHASRRGVRRRSVITPVSNRIWNNALQCGHPNPPTGRYSRLFQLHLDRYFETLRTPLLTGRNFNGSDYKDIGSGGHRQ